MSLRQRLIARRQCIIDSFHWIHWLSLPLLLVLAFQRSPLHERLGHNQDLADMFAGAILGFAGFAHLVHGLRNPFKGLHRALFLAAFAGSLTFIGISITSVASGVVAFRRPGLGYTAPADTWLGLVNWLALTALLTYLLHLLERHGAEAERQRGLAAHAQEALLRSRLAPHFIFNCLNILKAQIGSDPAGAEATTDRLASLFRQVVQVSGRASHSLAEEMNFVETYLGIEKARMGERLRVEVDLPEALETCQVLPLSLQVLVENAVKHGVGPLEAGGTVRIGAAREGNVLVLRVEDPGTGVSEHSGTGTAVATLRQRLARPADLGYALEAGRHVATLRWRQ